MFCFSVFGIICRYHGNTHSATVPKCVLHIYTSKRTCVPSLIWKCFFPSIVGIIYCYHGNTFFPILKKVSCTSTPQGQHVNPISLNCFSRHCPKMCHAHFNVNMYAKFDLKCISPSIYGNTLSSTVKKCVLHNYTIRPPCVPNFTFKCLKSVKVVQSAKFSPFLCPDMLLPW